MFEPDEFIFSKIAHFFKRRQKKKEDNSAHIVFLKDISPRLTILARALTGKAIQIYPAEREGGYKNNAFFLPQKIHFFNACQDNLFFYLFRVLFLSIQKELQLNWQDKLDHTTASSQKMAAAHADEVLSLLFKQFPISKHLHTKYIKLCTEQITKNNSMDSSYIYGKWMNNSDDGQVPKDLNNFSDKIKKAQNEAKTTLIAKAVEEIKSVQIDQKQLEDAVLQHQFEKVETAEEFSGNFRDMDGDDDLQDHANALEDLHMKYTVRVDDPTHSIYQAEFVENTTIAESADRDENGYFLAYDEWDDKNQAYKYNYCKVYPLTIQKTDPNYYLATIKQYRSVLMALRKMMTSLNNKYRQQRRQTQGEEFDLDAITDRFVDIYSRRTPNEKIYLSKQKIEKDLSLILLLDVSLSSDGYAANNRIIDVEKQISILFGEILNELNIDFSIDCFYSKTRNHTSYITIKGFDDSWNKSKIKLGAIQPGGYTRIGTALRHAGAMLALRQTKNKWIILLSDGKPNDYDRYEGKYGIQDVKQALRELNTKGIHSYALAIESQARYYLPQMFGQNHYQILTTPLEMLHALVKLYNKIKIQA